MTTVHNSKFFKGDTRVNSGTAPGGVYTTILGSTMVNDVFLPAAAETEIMPTGDSHHIILPIVGSITAPGHEEQIFAPGSIYSMPNDADRKSVIKNLSVTNMANYLHLSYTDSGTPPGMASLLNLTTKNTLVSAKEFPAIKLGIYDGRQKDILHLHPGSSLFTYIINGSFEVDGRLMEYRDGLYQWQVSEIDFEALSEAAIILFIECSPLK